MKFGVILNGNEGSHMKNLLNSSEPLTWLQKEGRWLDLRGIKFYFFISCLPWQEIFLLCFPLLIIQIDHSLLEQPSCYFCV